MSISVTRSSSNIRNDRIELLVHYSLQLVDTQHFVVQRRFLVGPTGFGTEFDHRIIDSKRKLNFLGQTTCYKVSGGGAGEPNKTYEMRETLMEYLLIYINLESLQKDIPGNIRFFHVIIGDPKYAYSYFNKIRTETYDLNIVLNPKEGVDVLYAELESLLPHDVLTDEYKALSLIEKAYRSSNYPAIKNSINLLVKEFRSYLESGCPRSLKGAVISKATSDIAASRNKIANEAVLTIPRSDGIKKLYLDAVRDGSSSHSKEILAVVKKIFSLRPFLPEAIIALKDKHLGWQSYVTAVIYEADITPSSTMQSALTSLWNLTPRGKRELVRRILIKLPSLIDGTGKAYPQDIPVKGVTEHSIYNMIFDGNITSQIITYLQKEFAKKGIKTSHQLIEQIRSRGRPIVKDSFEYDIKNGTVVRPALYFAQNLILNAGFIIKSPLEALGAGLFGFYGELFGVKIHPFTSIDVICSKSGKPLAFFKAKYFRPQEFDRRVKEEGFVSLTASFKLTKSEKGQLSLEPVYPNLPWIMFIDTEPDWIVDKEAVSQLIKLGWTVFFTTEQLIHFLSLLEKKLDK